MLAHVAAHRYGFEGYGIATGDLQVAMTNILYVSVTGQRAPEVPRMRQSAPEVQP